MLAIMGHMSRAMLERYSHIWMTAKWGAVEALSSVNARTMGGNSEAVPTRVLTISDATKVHYA
jgi:hypothetical protein